MSTVTSQQIANQLFNNIDQRTDFLHKLQAAKKLTKDGANWLRIALDPYHDFETDLAGYPDTSSEFSVVEKVNRAVTVSKPSQMEAGDTWRCCIFSLPIQHLEENSIQNCYQDTPGELLNDNAGQVCEIDSINIWKCVETADPLTSSLWPSTAADTRANWIPSLGEYAHLEAKPEGQIATFSRIIAQGFEVHNVTPELYKSGSVTVGKIPQTHEEGNRFLINANPVTDFADLPVMLMAGPPATPAEAIAYPSARKWDAAAGSYNIVALGGPDVPFEPLCQRSVAARGYQHQTSAEGQVMVSQTSTKAIAVGTETYDHLVSYFNQFAHTLGSFAFYDGLNENTVLEVSSRSYVELAPRTGNSLLPLAKKPAAWDIKALQMYSVASSMMPAGVPVGMNAKGDWFKNVGRILGDAALVALPEIGAAVGGPIGAVAGTAASLGIGGAVQAIKRKKQKKKAKAQGRVVTK